MRQPFVLFGSNTSKESVLAAQLKGTTTNNSLLETGADGEIAQHMVSTWETSKCIRNK